MRSRYRPAWNSEDGTDLDLEQFQVGGSDIAPVTSRGSRVLFLPLEFSMGEQIFGRDFKFTFKWMVMTRPEKAPRVMRFGYPPNILSENQLNPAADFENKGPLVHWDWQDWLASMISPLGASADDMSWGFHLSIPVPNPDPASSSTSMVTLTLLEDWGTKTAPMSIGGADNLRFEGDNRMEPCQPTPDFWYSINQYGFSANGDYIQSQVFNSMDDSSTKLLVYYSDVALIENGQVINVQSLNDPDDPTPIIKYVDGESNEGVEGKIPVETGMQTGKTATTHIAGMRNNVGGNDSVYNPVQHAIAPTSNKAPRVQSLGAPTYKLHCTGYAKCLGKPINPPKISEYGTAKAVRSGSPKSTSSVEMDKAAIPGAQTSLVKWDLWYDLIGTPNGVMPRQETDESLVTDHRRDPSPIWAEGNQGLAPTRRLG